MATLSSICLKFLIILLIFYKKIISPLLGNNCRFSPTCSSYGIEALQRFGIFKGILLIIKRILKCHSLHICGYDPVPIKKIIIENSINEFAKQIFVYCFIIYIWVILACLEKRKNYTKCKNHKYSRGNK